MSALVTRDFRPFSSFSTMSSPSIVAERVPPATLFEVAVTGNLTRDYVVSEHLTVGNFSKAMFIGANNVNGPAP